MVMLRVRQLLCWWVCQPAVESTGSEQTARCYPVVVVHLAAQFLNRILDVGLHL